MAGGPDRTRADAHGEGRRPDAPPSGPPGPIPGAAGARPFGAEDEALLARVAARVVALRLEVPALLTIETALPLAVVAGQALTFFQPFAQAFVPLPDYDRFARLLQRRDALETLAARIEAGAAIARDARRHAGR